MSDRILAIAIAAAALATAGCERAPTPTSDDAQAPPAVARGDNGFEVRITLSETAARTLALSGDGMIVSADYFGYPTVAAQQRKLPGTEDPWLPLHQHEIALEGAGTVEFPSVALDAEKLKLVERGRPQLLVNVRSTGDAGTEQDNLLDCGTYQDTLSLAVRTGVDLDCKLAAE